MKNILLVLILLSFIFPSAKAVETEGLAPSENILLAQRRARNTKNVKRSRVRRTTKSPLSQALSYAKSGQKNY